MQHRPPVTRPLRPSKVVARQAGPKRMISIIVPTLNEARNITDTLQPLQRLRWAGHELVVADGGSVDRTRELARPLADRVTLVARGRARQMNAAAVACTGELLWFLHADTQASFGAVDQLLAAVAAGAEWGWFDVRLSGHGRSLRLVEWSMNRRSRLTRIATGDQGIFVSRRLFQAVGGFPDIPLMEDVALSKALKQRARPHCLSGPLTTSSRRWEEFGVWRTVLLMWRLRLAYWLGADPAELHRRYYGRPPR